MRPKMLVFMMAMVAIVLFKAAALTGGEETRPVAAKVRWESKLPHLTENSFTKGKFVLVYRGTRLNERMKKSIQLFEEQQERYQGLVEFLLLDVDKDRSLFPRKHLPEEIEYGAVDVARREWNPVLRKRSQDGPTLPHTEIGAQDLQGMVRDCWKIEPDPVVAKTAPAAPTQGNGNGTGNGNGGNGTRTTGGGGQQN